MVSNCMHETSSKSVHFKKDSIGVNSHLYRLTCQMGGVKYEPAAVDDDGAGGSFRQSRKMLNNSRMSSREEQ